MEHASNLAPPASKHRWHSRPISQPSPRLALALIGPGRVGSRLMERLADGPAGWRLCAIANSASIVMGDDLDVADWPEALADSELVPDIEVLNEFLARQAADRTIIIDATASKTVASHHADWLASGIDLVTANKWGLAAPAKAWQRLMDARRSRSVRYECLATVGAGLPVLDTIGDLNRADEAIVEIHGSLSGTMTRLLSDINAGLAPAQALARAYAEGLTEPDPRCDLDGVDVARKLVILAREAGIKLELAEVQIDSLVPEQLRDVSLETFLRSASILDECWARCAAAAPGQGEMLSFTGRLDHRGQARVGLEKVPADSALASLKGAENRVEIRTACYRDSPLVIQGCGAGIEVTTLALWSGLMRISRCAESDC